MTNARNHLAGLRGHHLFAGLSPQQMQRLLTASHVDDHEAGQVLFDRGQPAQYFFIVLEGQVNLVLYSKAGEEKIEVIDKSGKNLLRIDTAKNTVSILAEQDIKLEAKGNIELKAANIKLEATAKVSVDGSQVQAEAKSQIALKGAMAELSASGITKISGSMVNIN